MKMYAIGEVVVSNLPEEVGDQFKEIGNKITAAECMLEKAHLSGRNLWKTICEEHDLDLKNYNYRYSSEKNHVTVGSRKYYDD